MHDDFNIENWGMYCGINFYWDCYVRYVLCVSFGTAGGIVASCLVAYSCRCVERGKFECKLSVNR